MAVISRPTNGFGYRAEPGDSTPASAFPLIVQNGTQVSYAGLIIHPSDLDYYSFTSGPGVVSFTVSVPAGVNNLAPRIELLDASGSTVIASAGPSAADFSASITATLPAAGSYRILVASSDGHYGNVGQYSITRHDHGDGEPGKRHWKRDRSGTGTGTVALNPPAAVSAIAVSSGRIDLTWAAVPGATGFQIERANSQGSWVILGTTTRGITDFSDVSVAPGTTYTYRVRAIGSGQTSSPSVVATATTPAASRASGRGLAAGHRLEGTATGRAGLESKPLRCPGLHRRAVYQWQEHGGSSAGSPRARPDSPTARSRRARPTSIACGPSTPWGLSKASPADAGGHASALPRFGPCEKKSSLTRWLVDGRSRIR